MCRWLLKKGQSIFAGGENEVTIKGQWMNESRELDRLFIH